jgi:hypothetical protein
VCYKWQSGYSPIIVGKLDADTIYLPRVLYLKGWLCVREVDKFQYEVSTITHDSKVAKPIGEHKTIEIIKGIYYYPRMGQFIEDYV